jgi:hypothetical protein
MLRAISVALALTLVIAGPVRADEVQTFGSFTVDPAKPEEIAFRGIIVSNTPLEFRRALVAAPDATRVVLDSPGGAVDSGLIMAYMIHDRGLATVVPDGSNCYSSCAFAFLAGSERLVAGRLGVHQLSGNTTVRSEIDIGLREVRTALDDFGVNRRVYALMMRTPFREMYVFSGRDLVEWGIAEVPTLVVSASGE